MIVPVFVRVCDDVPELVMLGVPDPVGVPDPLCVTVMLPVPDWLGLPEREFV